MPPLTDGVPAAVCAPTRIALLANPDAGGGIGPDTLAGAFAELGVEVSTFPLRLAAEAARSGVDRVVVAGGDGSVGPAAAAAAAAGVDLAVVATGTANDFSRWLGLPAELDEACALAARGTTVRAVDLGRFGEQPFVNAASAGLGAGAAERAAPLKRFLGPLAYPIGGIGAGLGGPTVHATVTVDGEERFSHDAWQVTVACGGAFGGGARLETTVADDGQLDVAVIERSPRATLPRRAWALMRGHLHHEPGVHTFRGRRIEVALDADDPAWTVDGELRRPGASVAATVDPATLRVVVPGPPRT